MAGESELFPLALVLHKSELGKVFSFRLDLFWGSSSIISKESCTRALSHKGREIFEILSGVAVAGNSVVDVWDYFSGCSGSIREVLQGNRS